MIELDSLKDEEVYRDETLLELWRKFRDVRALRLTALICIALMLFLGDALLFVERNVTTSIKASQQSKCR